MSFYLDRCPDATEKKEMQGMGYEGKFIAIMRMAEQAVFQLLRESAPKRKNLKKVP